MEAKTAAAATVKPTGVETGGKLNAFHGVSLTLLCAVLSELILGSIDPGDQSFPAVGRIAIIFLSLYTIHRFALASLHSYRPTVKDLLLLTLVLIASVTIIWGGRIFAIGLTTYAQEIGSLQGMGRHSFQFAIPYAAGALLLQAVLGLHFGLVFSISLAVIVGVYSPNEPILLLYVLVTSLIACLSLSRFRSRSAYIKAGFNIALLALPFALATIVIDGSSDIPHVVICLAGALFGGVLCTFAAAGFTPVVETLGGYVTDMRLLEMATLDHPLLKELSIQSPGTWNHSMVMGMMVEAAADAIGANAVLARTGAYFHDIGKMKKPLYFVENQGGGENRHDKLSTSMSALIIRSHVKDGIELGKKHKLPQAILDMIPQHHGTSLIEFFYDKACKEAREAEGEDAEVDESLYSYPGPKPQTREAGILMLADGIEAAARTLSEPTPDRVQGMVQKMINKVFASGQLNECDLTLQDLHRIASSFTRVLSSIYHQRIAYAEPVEKGVEKAPAKASNGKTDKKAKKKATEKEPEKAPGPEAKEPSDEARKTQVGDSNLKHASDENSEDGEDKEDDKEDLKRLGL